MMNFDLRQRRVRTPKFNIGDHVVITSITNASLNLYEKTKRVGYSYIHCPCHVKAGTDIFIEKEFSGGFLLRSSLGFLTVAHPNDLRKVQNG